MRNAFLIALFAIVSIASVSAQKIGYVDSQILLSSLSEVKAAESDLISYRDQQQKLLQSKVQLAEAEYKELVTKQQAGELTPKQIQDGQASLQKKQEEIAKLEASIQEKLLKRRNEKFQPILDKINTQIASYAKANGFQYILDVAQSGVITYADESLNITEKIKASLTK